MGMAAILFNGAEPFEQTVNILSKEGPMWNLVKTVEAVSEKTFNCFTILYMYRAQRQEQITPKILTVALKQFYFFNHCKFQPLVFNTYWENDFSLFSPHKCMWVQIWPCHKEVKGHPMTIIWTNLVYLESQMLYTKIQPQSFLGSGEEDF